MEELAVFHLPEAGLPQNMPIVNEAMVPLAGFRITRLDVLARPLSKNVAKDLLPRLLTPRYSITAEGSQSTTGLEPSESQGNDFPLLKPVEGFADGNQLDRRGGKLKFLGSADLPSNVVSAEPCGLAPPHLDHLGFLVHGQDLGETRRQRKGETAWTGGQIE